MTPVNPPTMKTRKKPITYITGVAMRNRPDQIVEIQQKICTPVGSDDHQARGGEEALAELRQCRSRTCDGPRR